MSSVHSYAEAAAQHLSANPFRPLVPVSALPYLSFTLLLASFFGAFFFTTLPKRNAIVTEVAVAVFSSLCAGFGIVALFNSVGVYV